MPQKNFDVEAARRAGYSEDDILQHLARSRGFDLDGALKAGYSKGDVITHLSSSPAAGAEEELTEKRNWLEPGPGEGALSRGAKGVGRAVRGLVRAPWDIGKEVLSPPRDPEEAGMVAGLSMMPGGRELGLGFKRILVDPQREMARRARAAAGEGQGAKAAFHSVAAAVPVAGPLAGEVYRRSEEGDVAGAVGEGAGNVALALGAPRIARPMVRAGVGAVRAVRQPLSTLEASATRLLSTPRVIRGLGGGAERMQTRPVGGPAASSFSRGEVADYAASKGIDLLPGQATESRPLQGIQAVGERAIVGGEKLQTHLEGQQARLAGVVEEFKNQAAGRSTARGTEATGVNLKGQVAKAMEKLKADAHADFNAWLDSVGEVRVDVKPIAHKWAAKLKEMKDVLRSAPARHGKPIGEILEKGARLGKRAPETIVVDGQPVPVAELPEVIRQAIALPKAAPFGMRTAQQLRSMFLEVSRDFSGNIPKRVNAIASELAKDLDVAMEQASLRVSPEAAETWRAANAKWKLLEQHFDSADSPLHQVMQETDPIRVPEKVLQRGEAGGSPHGIRLLKEHGVDLAPLRAEVIERIAQSNFRTSAGGNRLGGYSHGFLQELFEPGQLAELYKMGQVARVVRFEMNPSGTSNVMETGTQGRSLVRRVLERPHSVAGAGLGYAVGGVPGALIGAGATDALTNALAARVSLNPRLARAARGLPEVRPPRLPARRPPIRVLPPMPRPGERP
jgi:hypothetical protein